MNQKRLEKARNLLAETDMRISEIAYLVGIESPRNLANTFSRLPDHSNRI
ncbi:helix-turn-helix domain-containing protein [Dyadobacter subterraneus]|uniref:Helix-turn-helix domain-containing protein n=1 Tax=Dyadobacter subterraneus TaxID=2773304 RepID=A0ABR9WGU1_9BACT|nr:helix-turn-helix domain-containing protein [Dyadobacter subterraneus]